MFWRRGFHEELSEAGRAPVGRNVLMLSDLESSENYTCVAVSKLGNIEAVAAVLVKGSLLFHLLLSGGEGRKSEAFDKLVRTLVMSRSWF